MHEDDDYILLYIRCYYPPWVIRKPAAAQITIYTARRDEPGWRWILVRVYSTWSNDGKWSVDGMWSNFCKTHLI